MWTQDQIDQAFGALVLGLKLKWTFFSLLLLLGLTFLGLTVFYFLRYRKLRKELSGYGIIEDEKDADILLGSEKTPRDSEDDFGSSPPAMARQERVFNLHGQGKPFVDLNQTKTDSNMNSEIMRGN